MAKKELFNPKSQACWMFPTDYPPRWWVEKRVIVEKSKPAKKAIR